MVPWSGDSCRNWKRPSKLQSFGDVRIGSGENKFFLFFWSIFVSKALQRVLRESPKGLSILQKCTDEL